MKEKGLFKDAEGAYARAMSIVEKLLNHPEIEGRTGEIKMLKDYLEQSMKSENAQSLKKEWQGGRVVKKYFALVWGHPKEKGEIVSELARSPKDFRRRMVVRPEKQKNKEIKGKLAITEYKIIKKFRDFSLVEVYPKTGRMHQIRVHMASLGHPVAGDKLYGRSSPFGRSPVGRQFLHAFYLKFSLYDGPLAFEADLPEDLKKALTKLEK